MTINERIKQLRLETTMNGLQVSRMLGINATVLHNIEKGRNLPGADMIVKLCKFYNVSADYLLGLKKEKN